VYRPFQALGKITSLVEQMIDFQEELPSEWQAQWEKIQNEAGIVPEMNQAGMIDSIRVNLAFL
jgi:hypothetical protein